MQNRLIPAFSALCLFSVALPLTAGADTATNAWQSGGSPSQTMNQSSQTTTTTSQVTSNNNSSGAPISFEEYSHHEVVLGPDAATTVTPRLLIGVGDTSINVFNPSPKPVMFSVPALNLNTQVPANSERIIQIDRAMAANLTPGQEVAYYVDDQSGNHLASSTLVNNQEIASMIDTNTEVATTETTTTTTTETRQAATPASPSRRATVRGYW